MIVLQNWIHHPATSSAELARGMYKAKIHTSNRMAEQWLSQTSKTMKAYTKLLFASMASQLFDSVSECLTETWDHWRQPSHRLQEDGFLYFQLTFKSHKLLSFKLCYLSNTIIDTNWKYKTINRFCLQLDDFNCCFWGKSKKLFHESKFVKSRICKSLIHWNLTTLVTHVK